MRGQNYSSKRQAIYQTIKGTTTHPSAKWVYDSLKDEHPDLSLGTVYRNIALFKEQGVVVPVATVDGEERLDGNVQEHAHFVCECCSNVYDIFSDEKSELERTLESSGFEVTRKNLTYFGKCKDCR